jgi:hypothetical protein
MAAQQAKIEALTARVIRLETVLELTLSAREAWRQQATAATKLRR